VPFGAGAAGARKRRDGLPHAATARRKGPELGDESVICVSVVSETAAVISSVNVSVGEHFQPRQLLVTTELMKMRQEIRAVAHGLVTDIEISEGDAVEAGAVLLRYTPHEPSPGTTETVPERALPTGRSLEEMRQRHGEIQDAARPEAVARRRAAGMRTARENVDDLLDPGSFLEYGALALAAQRRRYGIAELRARSPGDGIVTGIGTVNAGHFGAARAACAVAAVDYTVMAGTQGFFHHKKIDRLLSVVEERPMPLVIFAEGGGGRPNDTDPAEITFSGLDVPTFYRFARLSGRAPRVAIVAGRCFAGNAAFAACADVVITTANANLGMGGPAMIEGGGLGSFAPEEIGPAAEQSANGVVDVLVADEAEAVAAARRYIGFFQGDEPPGAEGSPLRLRDLVPEDRQLAYDMRAVIDALFDEDTAMELRAGFAPGMITTLGRIEGRPFGLIANNPLHLGGAIDPDACDKTSRFLQLCDSFGLPIVSLCDTPGFMVGPEVERAAHVRRTGRFFLAGASLTVPLFTVILRKGYGLGAQAMAGGSFHRPFFTAAWPTAEVGAMGLEGAVRLGARRRLEAIEDEERREAVFRRMVGRAYQRGKAVNAASLVEFDAVIDPADTRRWLLTALAASGPVKRSPGRVYVDAW
jgi:acetyl-CoA carboxylase carboxyltransferase component